MSDRSTAWFMAGHAFFAGSFLERILTIGPGWLRVGGLLFCLFFVVKYGVAMNSEVRDLRQSTPTF